MNFETPNMKSIISKQNGFIFPPICKQIVNAIKFRSDTKRADLFRNS